MSISALSIPEVFARLIAMDRQAHWTEVWSIYAELSYKILPADEEVAYLAVRLRAAPTGRLPTIDGLIAAMAIAHQLTLVHRNPHLTAISEPYLRQMPLPDK